MTALGDDATVPYILVAHAINMQCDQGLGVQCDQRVRL